MNREITTILPGEYCAAAGDSVICTVLGSCVSVALFDPVRKTGGLNHFMLPGKEMGYGREVSRKLGTGISGSVDLFDHDDQGDNDDLDDPGNPQG